MKPNFVSIGAFCAALGVALGAFGAHALRDKIGAAELGLWETATRYFLLGALGTVLFGLFQTAIPLETSPRQTEPSPLPGWLLLTGSAVFSLSLYGMALGGPHILGILTPIGGLGLCAGFVGFALLARRRW